MDMSSPRSLAIQAACAEEFARNQTVTQANEIPISYECISSEWLSKVMCAKTPGAAVIAHSLDTPDEGTTNRRRIFLRYNAAGVAAELPASVFCKASQSLPSRLLLGLNGCVEREVDFHNRVRSRLTIEAPQAYFANVDRHSQNSIVLLKDMLGKVEFCDEKTPISLERAKSQMQLLATVHAAFREDSPKNGDLAQDFSTFENFFAATEMAVNWASACATGFQAAQSVVPPRLHARATEIWPATRRAAARHGELPRTLIHNDVHLKNWYIAASGEMGLGDWQCCVMAHWSRDLAYAMVTALTVENRRAWEMELINYYLQQLAAAGGQTMRIEAVMPLYRQQMLCALAMWTGTLTPSAGSPDMQPPATSIEFIKRIAHAMDDLDTLGA